MKKTTYLKKTLLFATIIFMVGCETGVDNKQTQEVEAQSGIVNNNQINAKKSTSSIKKIFSNSGTPGYYLQVGFFEQHKPNTTFMNRLKHSNLHYTILEKGGNHYALIGAYKSYNQAKSKTSAVKSTLKQDTFVVQVLRP